MNVARLAMQEIRAGLRNRWVVATTLLLAALSLSLALLGSAPTGVVKADPLAVVVVSLASLTIFLVPLIALLLSFDAVVGEQRSEEHTSELQSLMRISYAVFCLQKKH